jgi:poly-gamma-glutamate capsule biosynthesis protein CapA/YwtB (metallophosphatase superfamily)
MNDPASQTVSSATDAPIRLFLCGDVMLGRGIDQILPRPCDPRLYESCVASALDYVQLAEQANGPIPFPVDVSYVWGAALQELERVPTGARIINLETSITRSNDFDHKGINYRMSPENADCLTAAGINCCVLANNHLLDWGRSGLIDTLATLDRLGIKCAGAGRDLARAEAPAVLDLGASGRLLVFSFASVTSGTPLTWAATDQAGGINILKDLSDATAAQIADRVARVRRKCDVVVASVHWGPNWGYRVTEAERRFAHALIDRAGVSIVHGHSSHHAKALEVYRNRLILYGCGDFLNDYEGIRANKGFRDDLPIMYFVTVDGRSADLVGLDIVPFQIRRFRLEHPSSADVDWLVQTLDRESCAFGTRVVLAPHGRITLSQPGLALML